ncbi:hypothetical protein VTP01DRAFT_4716 [Rhizomucor pusillus]|uniref:uncharacterized protein n=1 Tax=Rhizomucor pusillus TaxID=4840 RepID=UPI003743355B
MTRVKGEGAQAHTPKTSDQMEQLAVNVRNNAERVEQNTGAAAVVATAVTATFRSSENGDQDDTLRANNMLQDQDAKELALNWQADDVFHFAQQCRLVDFCKQAPHTLLVHYEAEQLRVQEWQV